MITKNSNFIVSVFSFAQKDRSISVSRALAAALIIEILIYAFQLNYIKIEVLFFIFLSIPSSPCWFFFPNIFKFESIK
jgi:hypothetical protein